MNWLLVKKWVLFYWRENVDTHPHSYRQVWCSRWWNGIDHWLWILNGILSTGSIPFPHLLHWTGHCGVLEWMITGSMRNTISWVLENSTLTWCWQLIVFAALQSFALVIAYFFSLLVLSSYVTYLLFYFNKLRDTTRGTYSNLNWCWSKIVQNLLTLHEYVMMSLLQLL